MKEAFIEKRFIEKTRNLIDHANVIIGEYQAMGFSLTLRQLYYQFVARDIIPNNMRSYKIIGNVINDARLAGLIDWDAIEDRTRNLRALSHWDTGADIVQGCANQFMMNRWDNQEVRLEVWIEKDALIGVIEGACKKWDVPYFACRGFASQSELYSAGKRFQWYLDRGQRPIVIHLGDHDPSGIDMTRDNESRLEMFSKQPIEVRRIALNIDQVQQYNPPPNPAKTTDSRYEGYTKTYGIDSWELDALDPVVINDLVEEEIKNFLDEDQWDIMIENENVVKSELADVALDFENRGI